MSKWIWEPAPEWIEKTNVHRFMQRLGIADLDEFLRFSQEQSERFWDELVREMRIGWSRPYDAVVDLSRGVEWARWFTGGELNIAHNCLDRHANSGRIACLWEGEDGTTRTVRYADLHRESNQVANALEQAGLRAGDRVAICMPMIPEVVAIMYGCFKIGAVVVPIFSGFGPGAISTRLADSGARIVFTADQALRRGKLLPLKQKIDEALEKAPSVERVIVRRYKGGVIPFNAARDQWYYDFHKDQSGQYTTKPLDSETQSFILYTSGTTGKPKGAVHTHAGCLVQMAKEIFLAFDHKDTDLFFWLSDIGWMMGPWTIIGNHNFGGTIFLYDGAPDVPGPDRLWQMVERHHITTMGISPTAIRVLMRAGDAVPERYAMDSLRLLGSTGEPWDEVSYRWYFEKVGKRRSPIINISGGTELAGSFLFPLPIQALKPCSLGKPAPGMATDVVDERGNSVRGKTGYLVCKKPVPSMTRGVWGDPKRYIETYWSRFPGWWYHGDWASVDEDGCWYVHGRADESMNVAGRKVGPAEIEEAMMEHPSVAEAAVIGVPDEITGEAIVGFFVPKPGAGVSPEAVSRKVEELLGPTLRPRELHEVPQLPKTQSGKVVRRLIRQRFLGEALGDLTTVEDPAALDAFANRPKAAS
jgi:acetyl-CoA synthetase